MGLASAALSIVSLVRRGEGAPSDDAPDEPTSVHEAATEVLVLEANRETLASAVEAARRELEKAERRDDAARRRADDALLEGGRVALEKARRTMAQTEREIAAARRALAEAEESLATVERCLAEAREALAKAKRAAKVERLRAAASPETFHAAIAPAVDRIIAAWSELDAAEREIEAAYAASCDASAELRDLREPVPETRDLTWAHLGLALLERLGMSPAWIANNDVARLSLPQIFMTMKRGRTRAKGDTHGEIEGGSIARALVFLAERRKEPTQYTAADIPALLRERDPVSALFEREIAERYKGRS